MDSFKMATPLARTSSVEPAKFKRRRSKPGFVVVLSEIKSGKTRTKTANTWEQCRRYYYGYAKWVTRKIRRCISVANLSEAITEEDILNQGRFLVQEYVSTKMRKQGLLGVKGLMARKIGALKYAPLRDLCVDLQYFGAELEKLYPELYKNVGRQLNVTFKKNVVICDTFMSLADDLFRAKITWGRVVALFSMAAAFATDCVQHGHNELVGVVVDSFVQVVTKHLSTWIIQQGGWGDMRRTFRTCSDAAAVWGVTFSAAFVGFLFTATTLISLTSS